MKNNLNTLIKALLQEAKDSGKEYRKEVIDGELILHVEAFGHKYRIENPYMKKCKIYQEDTTNDNLHY